MESDMVKVKLVVSLDNDGSLEERTSGNLSQQILCLIMASRFHFSL